jgi:hypothetical protein
MKKINLILTLLLAIGIMIGTSCKKREQEEPQTTSTDADYQTSLDFTKSAQAESSDFKVINDYGIKEPGIKTVNEDTVSVTITDTDGDFPKTLVLNFGSACSCNDGHVRQGKVIVVFSGHWGLDSIEVNTTAEVSFEEYYVDGVKHEGTFKATYLGKNDSNGPKYEWKATNAKLIYPDSTFISWNSTKNISWVAGYKTLDDRTDDVFYVNGTKTGVSKKGLTFTAKVTKDLKVVNSCQDGTITEGIFGLTPQNKPKRIVDFGDGTCDRIATVTIDGVTYKINF